MSQKQVLHFAHGNGFTVNCYTKLLNILSQDYEVIALKKLGHNPEYPVDENWDSITRELIAYIEDNAAKPIIGVGHSLGSILTFLAAQQRPDLFTKIVMVDPPLFYGPFTLFLRFMKSSGLIDKIGLAARTKKRRTDWASREVAKAFFRQRSPFDTFDPDCLQHYIEYGTEDIETGVRLVYDTDVESMIFRTTPHNLGSFKKKLAMPASIIIGENTYISTRYVAKSFAKRFGLNYQKFEGGNHFFPFVYPENTAIILKGAIEKLN